MSGIYGDDVWSHMIRELKRANKCLPVDWSKHDGTRFGWSQTNKRGLNTVPGAQSKVYTWLWAHIWNLRQFPPSCGNMKVDWCSQWMLSSEDTRFERRVGQEDGARDELNLWPANVLGDGRLAGKFECTTLFTGGQGGKGRGWIKENWWDSLCEEEEVGGGGEGKGCGWDVGIVG